MTGVGDNDLVLQSTCQAIEATVRAYIQAQTVDRLVTLRIPGGPIVGRQLQIDATEPQGPMNVCRLSLLDPDLAPAGEVVRIEYEHDKQTSHGISRVYSIQSIRGRAGELVLLENFLAAAPGEVRETDFRPIQSERYAQQTVLSTLKDWTRYDGQHLKGAAK